MSGQDRKLNEDKGDEKRRERDRDDKDRDGDRDRRKDRDDRYRERDRERDRDDKKREQDRDYDERGDRKRERDDRTTDRHRRDGEDRGEKSTSEPKAETTDASDLNKTVDGNNSVEIEFKVKEEAVSAPNDKAESKEDKVKSSDDKNRDDNDSPSKKRKDRETSIDSRHRDDRDNRRRRADSRDRSRRRSPDGRRPSRDRRDSERDRERERERDREKEREREREKERERDKERNRIRDEERRKADAKKEAEKPKKIQLKDIMAVNPGISLQEAISKLSSYNTAISMGLPPPSLTGLTQFLPVDMGPNAQQLMAAQAVNSSITGLLGFGGVDSNAATKPHRELYVGNLPPGCTSGQVTEFLNNCMKQLGFNSPLGSTISAWLSNDGHYAFVEFRTIEEANAALNYLSGVQVGAYQLKIGRPKGYTGGGPSFTPSLGVLPGGLAGVPGLGANPLLSLGAGATLGLAGLTSPAVSSAPMTVAMITNLPLGISDDQVKEFVSPFGSLKAFNCIKSAAGSSQTAIFEYNDSNATDLAVMGLSNIDLLGNKLLIQKIPQSAADVLLKPSNKTDSNTASSKSTEHVSANDERNSRIQPTRIIRLSNMTTDEDLNDDEMYEDLVDEIREECSNHGTVISVVIPRTGLGVGFVFVEFGSVSDAGKGFKAIAGRKFNGNIVVGTYYPENLYAQKVFTCLWSEVFT